MSLELPVYYIFVYGTVRTKHPQVLVSSKHHPMRVLFVRTYVRKCVRYNSNLEVFIIYWLNGHNLFGKNSSTNNLTFLHNVSIIC